MNTPSRLLESLFDTLTRAAGLFVLFLMILLVGVLVFDALPVIAQAGRYRLLSDTWNPSPREGDPTFGILGFVYGTIVTASIAMLIAVPLGVGTAAYLSEIARPKFRKIAAFLIELLAAIPSVVYGFWGLRFLSPRLRELYEVLGLPNTGGQGLFPAGVVLAVMVLPYITALAFDVCQAVPRSQREGSLALGATRWQTILRVVLPYARPGIIAACFLALGRALGETMAVTMLVGSQPGAALSPFGLGDSLAGGVARQVPGADTPEWRSALMTLAVVLLVLTAGFNIFARLLLRQLTRQSQPGPKPVPVPVGAEFVPGPTEDTGTGEIASERPAAATFTREPRETDGYTPAQRWDRVMTWVLRACVWVCLLPLFLILGYILVNGIGAVEKTLFTERQQPELTESEYAQYKKWQSTGRDEDYPRNAIGRPVRRGGLGHAMLGSVMVVLTATVFAVPVGLLAAIYLAESRNSPLADTIRFVTELLAGVPSIIVGLFAYACLVYPFWLSPGQPGWGFSGWAGAFALAVLMLPVVIRSAEESMRLVPDSLRQASYAIGANRMQTTLRVVLPAALPAIVTGVFLAVARVAGETAPLLVTAGLFSDWKYNLSGETATLPRYIYNYSTSDFDDLKDQGWGAAVVLLVVVMIVNIGIRLSAGKRLVAAARAD
jgi:phosphate transport system permease protein